MSMVWVGDLNMQTVISSTHSHQHFVVHLPQSLSVPQSERPSVATV